MQPPRLFHPLLLRIALVAVTPAAVVLWAFGPGAAALAGVVLAGVELWRVRRAVRHGVPVDVEFVPARPADHAWLDTEGFRSHLARLHELGFHPIADYTVCYPGAPDGFARALVSPAHRVYAEVGQVRQGRLTLPVATTLESVLTSGWTVQTSTRDPAPVAFAFMRSPRSVWCCRPGADLEELLEDHLALRDSLCGDLGLEPAGEGTVEGYFGVQRENHRRCAVAARRTGVVRGIVRGLRCERRARTEWLGDYADGAR